MAAKHAQELNEVMLAPICANKRLISVSPAVCLVFPAATGGETSRWPTRNGGETRGQGRSKRIPPLSFLPCSSLSLSLSLSPVFPVRILFSPPSPSLLSTLFRHHFPRSLLVLFLLSPYFSHFVLLLVCQPCIPYKAVSFVNNTALLSKPLLCTQTHTAHVTNMWLSRDCFPPYKGAGGGPAADRRGTC